MSNSKNNSKFIALFVKMIGNKKWFMFWAKMDNTNKGHIGLYSVFELNSKTKSGQALMKDHKWHHFACSLEKKQRRN